MKCKHPNSDIELLGFKHEYPSRYSRLIARYWCPRCGARSTDYLENGYIVRRWKYPRYYKRMMGKPK